MAKRLSEKEKKEIVSLFTAGKTIEELSRNFKYTKLTITRNLKIKIGDKKYNELTKKNKSSIQNVEVGKKTLSSKNKNDNISKNCNENLEKEYIPVTPFLEITPLDFDIENSPQKDFSSIPIADIDFPKIVYMIVDKKIELETKYLRDYPDWHFLSQDELDRKTIEIYEDLKNAKRFCNKEQKVIKVPNTQVFKIAATFLLNKGISRIINADKLIAL